MADTVDTTYEVWDDRGTVVFSTEDRGHIENLAATCQRDEPEKLGYSVVVIPHVMGFEPSDVVTLDAFLNPAEGPTVSETVENPEVIDDRPVDVAGEPSPHGTEIPAAGLGDGGMSGEGEDEPRDEPYTNPDYVAGGAPVAPAPALPTTDDHTEAPAEPVFAGADDPAADSASDANDEPMTKAEKCKAKKDS